MLILLAILSANSMLEGMVQGRGSSRGITLTTSSAPSRAKSSQLKSSSCLRTITTHDTHSGGMDSSRPQSLASISSIASEMTSTGSVFRGEKNPEKTHTQLSCSFKGRGGIAGDTFISTIMET